MSVRYMKKNLFFIAFLFITTLIKAQTPLFFKIKYLPDHLYESNITMDMNMNVSGGEREMDKIKAKGIKLPMIMNSTKTLDANIKTGAVKTESTFPIEIKYIDLTAKITLNGTEKPSPPSPLIGQTIYGEINSEGKIKVDSLSGKTLDENLKNTLTSVASNLINQTQFPEKALNIGDTFIQEVPFNLPIAGINMQMKIKIIYKLTAVENSSAYFDLDQTLNFDISTKKDSTIMTVKGTGNGEGKLVFSIDNYYPTSMKSSIDFNYQMSVGNMEMTGKAKIISNHQTKISLNIK